MNKSEKKTKTNQVELAHSPHGSCRALEYMAPSQMDWVIHVVGSPWLDEVRALGRASPSDTSRYHEPNMGISIKLTTLCYHINQKLRVTFHHEVYIYMSSRCLDFCIIPHISTWRESQASILYVYPSRYWPFESR